jgi:hypothetical protein
MLSEPDYVGAQLGDQATAADGRKDRPHPQGMEGF